MNNYIFSISRDGYLVGYLRRKIGGWQCNECERDFGYDLGMRDY